jgi:hypothetical protein
MQKEKQDRSDRLFEFFNRGNDGIEVRPVAGIEFGMDEFAIGANFEGAPARRNERERLDPLAEFKNLGRQTDGFRRVVSNYAVFDRYFGLHFELLSDPRLGLARRPVNGFGTKMRCRCYNRPLNDYVSRRALHLARSRAHPAGRRASRKQQRQKPSGHHQFRL